MHKTAFKIFICFTFTAAIIATILLIINFFGIAIISSDSRNKYKNSPHKILNNISNSLKKTEKGFELNDESIVPYNCWCIIIDENGNIIWHKNKPNDIPSKYSINDIARMTHWFLNDYPVYVSTEDYGLLVFGYPKNAVGKYNIEYSMEWFDTLPQRLLKIFALNLCLAAILAFFFGITLYRHIRILINGINDLRQEKNVNLKEKGIFKNISESINKTAATIERKNTALAKRDNARLNWISGISHDIRTPLSLIIGNSEALSENRELSEENKNKAKTITNQVIKIKKLVEDLNLISSLEYDMQPSKKRDIRICPLLRRVVTDIINSGLSDNFKIELKLYDEKATISADESLIERAVFNLINNSVTHNKNGCSISIFEYSDSKTVYLSICDNGNGVPSEVIERISKIPKSAHGLGLPMAYKIINVHNGNFQAVNNNGFTVKIELPKIIF